MPSSSEKSSKRKIAVVIVDRANYGRLKPVMQALSRDPDVEMQVMCTGTMILERFGHPINVLREDGFKVDSEIYIELEGSTTTTMAKSIGFAVIEFSSEFKRLKPDMILIIGDRYEAFAAAIAASYMNICIAHIQGGEVSGSIDESARHCITKLSHYHFPSTERSADYIVRMGEKRSSVFHVGCPSGDIALSLERRLPDDYFESHGNGAHVNPNEPFLLVIFHPVTTRFGEEAKEAEIILNDLAQIRLPTVWLWPNIDAGSNMISKVLRTYVQKEGTSWIRLVKNFRPDDFLKVLGSAACAVGNSSSFVRDSSFLGTPVVLIGDRQRGREYSDNVTVCPIEPGEIKNTVMNQLAKGRFRQSSLYGSGNAGGLIVEKLKTVPLYSQKILSFVDEE